MADIGEEDGFRPVYLRECFGTFTLVLIGLGVGDGAGDLRSHEMQEIVVVLVKLQARIDADHEKTGGIAGIGRGQRKHGCRMW
jgi:hypothetical protein